MKEKSIQQLVNSLSHSKIAKEWRPPRTDTHERFDDNPHYNYRDEGVSVRGEAERELLRRGTSIADELCQAMGNDRSYTTASVGSVKTQIVGDTIARILVEMGPGVIPVVKRYAVGGAAGQTARANWVLCQLGDVEGCLRFSFNVKSQLRVDLDAALSAQNAEQVERWLTRTLRAAEPDERPRAYAMQAILKKSKDDNRYRKILAGVYVQLSEAYERTEARQIIDEWRISAKDFGQLAGSVPTSALIRLELGQEQIVARGKAAFTDLIAALGERSAATFAAATLEKMKYVPANKSEILSYHLARGDFEACLQYGQEALDRLTSELQQGNMQPGLPLALAKTDDPGAKKALVDEFVNGNKHPELPRALIGNDDPRILDVAIERLRKGDPSPELVRLLATQESPRALDAMIERHLTEVRKGTVAQFNPTLAMTLGEMGDPRAINALSNSYNLAVALKEARAKHYSGERRLDNRPMVIAEALRQSDDRPRSLLDVLLGRRRWAG